MRAYYSLYGNINTKEIKALLNIYVFSVSMDMRIHKCREYLFCRMISLMCLLQTNVIHQKEKGL